MCYKTHIRLKAALSHRAAGVFSPTNMSTFPFTSRYVELKTFQWRALLPWHTQQHEYFVGYLVYALSKHYKLLLYCFKQTAVCLESDLLHANNASRRKAFLNTQMIQTLNLYTEVALTRCAGEMCWDANEKGDKQDQ